MEEKGENLMKEQQQFFDKINKMSKPNKTDFSPKTQKRLVS